jgi:eukaryotic-like serine/threonine-protein kinase
MAPERWEQVKQIYDSALEYAASERAAYLDQVCVGDEALRREVESLLVYEKRAEGFIQTPALQVAAKALAKEPTPSLIGRQLNHYQIIARLGAGGMGEVYLAEDSRLGRKVALKLLPARFTQDAERVQRFAREARVVSTLNHPNIITLHEIGQVDDLHYIITEFIEGQTLRQILATRMKLTSALEVALQVAAALSAAHEAGIVHRDIKPENLMLRHDGLVKILDFGIAKLLEKDEGGRMKDEKATEPPLHPSSFRLHPLTGPGTVMGTAGYMSPEQARGQKLDGRTDIFSLGVVLYEMIAGRAPFAGATTADVLVSVLEKEPPPLAPYAPAELVQLVVRALAKDREERYQTAKEMLLELRKLRRRLEVGFEWEQPLANELGDQVTLMRDDGQMITEPAPATRTTDERAPARTSAAYLAGALKRHKLGVAASLVLAVAAVVYYSFAAAPTLDSLAVLPFVNDGANPQTEYLSDGLTESIIYSLSQLPDLKVASRNSVFRYKDKEMDPQAVGRELGVRAVLTGRVRERGDDLLISVNLVDVRDNRSLWGQQYNPKLADILLLQTEIAQKISDNLRLRLTGKAKQQLAKRDTDNNEAYLLYLMGRHWFGKNTAEGYQKAPDYFQQAIALDPNYAAAYSALADVYSVQAATGAGPPAERLLKARAAAEKAVQLNDSLAGAHISLGHLKLLTWDWAGAEREFQRGVELDPPYPAAHLWYATYLSARGRHGEAFAIVQRALERSPVSNPINSCAIRTYLYAREYDQAIAAGLKTLELEPNDIDGLHFLAQAYEHKGSYAEAIAASLKALSSRGAQPEEVEALRAAYRASGWRGFWRKVLERKRAAARQRYVSPFDFAQIYVRLGERERAFEALEQAFAEHSDQLTLLKVDPVFDPLRSDSRYADLLRRVGLAP